FLHLGNKVRGSTATRRARQSQGSARLRRRVPGRQRRHRDPSGIPAGSVRWALVGVSFTSSERRSAAGPPYFDVITMRTQTGLKDRMRNALLIVALGGLFLATTWPQPARAADGARLPSLFIIERTTEPLVKADRPWEDFCLGYCQVLRVGDDWHLWYL